MRSTGHFNYTKRKRITRDQVAVTLDRDPLSFDLSLNLTEMGFPTDAKVIAEAYQSSSASLARFDFGTVGALRKPKSTALDSIDPAGRVLFRIKIVASGEKEGRLLGLADELRAENDAEDESLGSLLSLRPCDLGERVWEIDFGPFDSPENPVLCINNQIPGLADSLKSNPVYVSFVFPAVLREVLTTVFLSWQQRGSEDSWQEKWVEFADSLVDDEFPEPDDVDHLLRWRERVVTAFCKRHKTASQAMEQLNE